MVPRNTSPRGPAYTVSADAARGVTTGISAADRAHTVRVLADAASGPADLTRPGHVLPVCARPGGVLARPGYPEAAVDLCRLAGLPPVGVAAEVVTDPATGGSSAPASQHENAILALTHDLSILDIASVVRHRLFHGDGQGPRVIRAARTAMPSGHGRFDALGYTDAVTGAEHIALVTPAPVGLPVVAVHLGCTLGDVFSSTLCGCRQALDASLALVGDRGGAVVHLDVPHAAAGHTGSRFHPVPGDHEAGAAAAILSDLGLTEVLLGGGVLAAGHLAPGGVRGGPMRSPAI